MDILKRIQDQDKATLVRGCTKRVSALTVHPTTHTFLVASGSKNGEVGLMALGEDETNPVCVRMEGDDTVIGGLKFASDKLYSTGSFTGICRVLDPTAASYDTVVMIDEGVRGLDIRNETDMYLSGNGTGQVSKVDTRTHKVIANYPDEMDFRRFGSLWTVDCHPFDANYFVTSSNAGLITVWDDRQTREPLHLFEDAHSKSVSSAVFDRRTGNTIVTVRVLDLVWCFSGLSLYLCKISR